LRRLAKDAPHGADVVYVPLARLRLSTILQQSRLQNNHRWLDQPFAALRISLPILFARKLWKVDRRCTIRFQAKK
jgi:hypothetical protein